MDAQSGARFDYLNSSVPAQNASGGTWVGPRSFEALHDVPNWRDFWPRVGVVYDLFGNGKTAIKATLSRYVQLNAIGYARGANPFNASFSSATRSWNDVNGDLVPQADELGPLSNANFGTPGTDVRGNVINDEFDDNLREGWGVRRNNWEISAGIQHELLPRVSVEVLYTRRAQGNFQATDNLLVTPDDYDPYCVTAPTDPRLPGGGGFEICGLHDITPEKFGLSKRYTTHADNLGGRSQVYDGVDVTMNARMDNGAVREWWHELRPHVDRQLCRHRQPGEAVLQGLAGVVDPGSSSPRCTRCRGT